MLPERKSSAGRWFQRQLTQVPQPDSAESPTRSEQSGYSSATMPVPATRRPAPRVVLPVWAALTILISLLVLLMAAAGYGTYRFLQTRQAPDTQSAVVAVQATTPTATLAVDPTPTLQPTEEVTPTPEFVDLQRLSPMWSDHVLQWADELNAAAEQYQFDPNLLASILEHESGGDPNGVSYAGAVGLMGIMPKGSGAGLDQRPTASALTDPATNIEWGAKILSGYFVESEGNLHLALAVYNGGWLFAHTATPQAYAGGILDTYARAVLARSGVTVEADQWTIAIKDGEEISAEPLISDDQLTDGWPLYAKHTFLDGDSPLIGYAVPLTRE